MKNKLILTLISLFFCPQISWADSIALPKSCIPKYVATTAVKEAKPLAVVAYKGSTYHFMALIGKRKDEVIRVVIRRDRSCYLSFVDPGEAYSLSEGVPVPVAKTLALLGFQNAVKRRGGTAAYQRWFLSRRIPILAPEDAVALKALGIKIPSSTKILPWSQAKMKESKIGGGD